MGEHAASRRQWWARARRRRGPAPTTRRRTSTSTSMSLFLAAGRILCLPWQARGLVSFFQINIWSPLSHRLWIHRWQREGRLASLDASFAPVHCSGWREAKKSNREEEEKFENNFSNFERRKRNLNSLSPVSRREREIRKNILNFREEKEKF